MSFKTIELSGVSAISSLALLLEKEVFLDQKKPTVFQENFLQNPHLILSDPKNLDKLKSFLQFKNFKADWYDLPPFPKPKSPYSEMVWMKRRQWQAWASQSDNKARLFLASPQALLKKTNNSLKSFVIQEGEIFSDSVLKTYVEKALVERKGEFSSRGFLIDVFSPAYEQPLRLQLLGDTIESIYLLDKNFKKRKRELKQALIPSLYEWTWEGRDRKNLCDYLKQQEPILNKKLPFDLFKNFARGEIFFGFESILNCLDKTCSLDYFLKPPVIWFFEPEKTKSYFLEEKSNMEKEHPFFTSENLFLDWDKIRCNFLNIQVRPHQLKSLSFEGQEDSAKNKPSKTIPDQIKESKEKSLNKDQMNDLSKKGDLLEKTKENHFFQEPIKDSSKRDQKLYSFQDITHFSSSLFKKTKNLKEDLKNLPANHIVFVGQSEPLKKLLLKEKVLNSLKDDFFEDKSLIFLPGQIKESFFCKEETAYLRAEDFIPQKKQTDLSHFDFFRNRAKALEFSKLDLGDLLVHRQHGLGEFAGLQTLDVQGRREDFIVLHYKDGDKLFVPAYKAEQVKKYSRKRSDQINKKLLDRLGNPKLWERKKAKAKKHIQSLAIELIELYRQRKQKQRKPFAPVSEALKQFAEDFPWKETSDQQRAIQDIMSDMGKDRPMDRLLVADTGFGKTEVALRAVFRVLENHFQVCLLAPTTVLTLQHFENCKERFKKTPFQLELLNRFTPKKKRESIFQKVKEGKVDFLIATHSVFSSQLSFKNLGLIVLDEEHRFGVRQKERLFRFRKNLDVLSLSATPIPRTLNMALTGIKDISVISRPPDQRRPVKLIMKSWNEGAEQSFVKACQKEKARKGQILFVHNRVKSLYQTAERLQKLLPHFKIAIAHGQMRHLDKIMLDFFEKKYDLLVSTNIIESGMDMPEANTLFIDRVHEMGLSQIYQLKGRVGRSSLQAYCYMFFPDRDRLSVLARERLELLERYAGLGEAFQLALNDLENRGAGSLFGSEQSGHLQNLGEDLYFEILNEQITDQKSIFIEPEISLPFSTGIPESYIPEPRLRLLYYKTLSSAVGKEARETVKAELLEGFGPLPEELEHLFFLLEIRNLCKTLLIKDLKADWQSLSLVFHDKTPVSPELLLKLLENQQGHLINSQSCKIPLEKESFFEGIKAFLQELEEKPAPSETSL